MRALSIDEAHRAWITAEKIKRIADRLVGLGPFSVGLDGLLAGVPIAGTVFSLGAGLMLLAGLILLAACANRSWPIGFRR